MKLRIFALLVAMIMLVIGCIAGCNGNSTNESSKVTEPVNQTTVTTAAPTETVAPEPTKPAEPTKAPSPRLITEEITSPNIADNNMMGDTGSVKIFVYLPPNYFDSRESYPVVYFLHGHGETPGAFLKDSQTYLDKMFSDGEPAFIMVAMSGTGATLGSFYVNSPASGNWEDCLIKEVIPYVDANYRTLAKVESRGICGFSMGGFGAMNLALRNPDVFSAVYAMSPGIMKDDALSEAMKTWTGDTAFLQSYARAFAPNLEGSNFYGDIPTLDGTKADNQIAAKWYTGFGNWSKKLDAYLALKTPLRAIGISYGTTDSYTWIPSGSAYYVDLLRENGIEPTVCTFNGGHRMPLDAIQAHLGPFFLENLDLE
ncbi:MAG: alpha/beta hydrolase-fold protein [Oscillospiraceae bacterium]|nr:alpha/beta hydrolase-fold protein [Oscillospiraceae bacterium]